MENKTPTQVRRRHIRRLRFAAGCREMLRHPAKALVLLAYLLALAWAWINRGTLLTPLSFGNSLIYHCLGFALLLVATFSWWRSSSPWAHHGGRRKSKGRWWRRALSTPPAYRPCSSPSAKRQSGVTSMSSTMAISPFLFGSGTRRKSERHSAVRWWASSCPRMVTGYCSKLSPCVLLSRRKSTGRTNICPRRILRLCLV